MLLFECCELLPGGVESGVVKFGFESKMVEMSLGFVGFEFGEGYQAGKDVVLLGVKQF